MAASRLSGRPCSWRPLYSLLFTCVKIGLFSCYLEAIHGSTRIAIRTSPSDTSMTQLRPSGGSRLTIIVLSDRPWYHCRYITPPTSTSLLSCAKPSSGYHRLWAHTSYSATLLLRIFFAAVGGGAVEGSIRWWARDHCAHHRYTVIEKKPYSVRKGLLYSHFGWILVEQNSKPIGRIDISDLNEDRSSFGSIVIIWRLSFLWSVDLGVSFIECVFSSCLLAIYR